MASTILLMRNAEEPEYGFIDGVNLRGARDDKSLIVRGHQRAAALSVHIPSVFGLPTKIFVGINSKHTQRCHETSVPLSFKHGRVVTDLTIDCADIEGVVAAAEKCRGIVMIVWDRAYISSIGRLLSDETPLVWPENRYDMIYVYTKCGYVWSFVQSPQLLMVGDSKVLFGDDK